MADLQRVQQSPIPRVVCFGDSLTQRGCEGWLGHLAHAYQAKCDVINRGFSGYNTVWASALLPVVYPPPSTQLPAPMLTTIFFGANDAVRPESPNPVQHVSVESYREHLRGIIQHARTVGQAKHIIVIGPPPVDGPRWLEHSNRQFMRKDTFENRELGHTRLYSEAACAVASEEGVLFLELFESMQLAFDDWRSAFSDGLHFADLGNAYLGKRLLTLIRSQLPEISPKSLSLWQPDWQTQAAVDAKLSEGE